jgi:hypothetical protein
MIYQLYRILITLLFCITPNFVVSQTIIPPGDVFGIWTLANDPYLIQGDIQIPVDSTLTIEPGVTLEFQGHFGLYVEGNIMAIGTITDSILFTVSDTSGFQNTQTEQGGWKGIRFINPPNNQDSSLIDYCRLEFGKAVGLDWPFNSGGAIAVINRNEVRIAHSLLIHNLAGGTNGPSGGAIHISGSNIRMDNNVIAYNSAELGGGLHVHMSDVIFTQNVIEQNSATDGGGVWMYGSTPTFSEDDILDNDATLSGGGILMFEAQEGTVFTAVEFSGNQANWGGGLGAAGSTFRFDQSTFSDNHVSWLGGGIAADYCDIIVVSSMFLNDTTPDTGGAMHLDHSNVQLTETEFAQNAAFNGGAMNLFFSHLELDDCIFRENYATGNGGAIHIFNSDLVSEFTRFIQNTAVNEAGAIYYLSDSLEFGSPYEVRLTGTSFEENTALFNGGGAIFRQPNGDLGIQLVIEECSFTGNFSDRNSAMQVQDYNDFIFANNRVTDNSSGIRTSGVVFNRSTGFVSNSIFARNITTSGTAGCALTGQSKVDFMHCLFTENISGTAASFYMRLGSEGTATNCIFWNTESKQIRVDGIVDTLPSSITLNNCLVRNGVDSILLDSFSTITWGLANIVSDPLFFNTTSGDYHLSDGSVCIGAGIASIEINGTLLESPPFDLDGQSRPNPTGSNPDLGPFESELGIPTGMETLEDPFEISVFPNPVIEDMILEITLSQAEHIKAQIFSAVGICVSTLIDQRVLPGTVKYKWTPGPLPNGMYLIKIEVDGNVFKRKVILYH